MELDHSTLLRLLLVCAVASNDASDIRAAGGSCLDAICHLTGWPVGHLYLAAPDGLTLEPAGVWSVADPQRFAAFQQVIDQSVLKNGDELPGRVLGSGRPQWITGLPHVSDCPRRILAATVGVPAGLAFPILTGSAVTGVLEFFAPEVVPPDDFQLEVLTLVGRQLGEVVARHRAAAEQSARAHDEGLRQSAEIEAVGQLAGGIAHDFNNVLTAIYGSAYLLTERLPTDSPHLPYVTEIREAAERAAGMTRHLLAFGRRQTRIVVPVDVNALIQKLQKMLTRLIPDSIQVELRLRPDLPPISADYSQVEQVILNLVVNARDAMPHGGRLTIETSLGDFDDGAMLDHSGASSGSRVQITVSDNGNGMDPETQTRIFEPYFTTKGRHGTGLGLAIVSTIVKQSGGDIRVDSEPDTGSTFRVLLPISLDEVAAEPPRRVSETTGSEAIMLVEDDPAIRRLTSTILGNHGYSVLEAGSVDEALRLDPSLVARVALLVTDVVLPGGSGRRLAEELRERHPAMKVLFVSGYMEDVNVPDPAVEPGLAFLPKPFSPLDLVERVRRLLDEDVVGV